MKYYMLSILIWRYIKKLKDTQAHITLRGSDTPCTTDNAYTQYTVQDYIN